MTDFVDELLREHGEIRRVLRVVDQQLQQLGDAETGDLELLRDAMHFLTRYPDLFHHGCEDVVFRRLHQRDGEAREFIRDLSREHGLLRDLGLEFLGLCEIGPDGTRVQTSRLISIGRRYLLAQHRHMRKEEETVFPRIRSHLGAEDWAEIQSDLERMAAWRVDADMMRERFRSLHAYLAQSQESREDC